MSYSHRGMRVRVPHWGAQMLTYLLDWVASDFADDPPPIASPLVGRVGQLEFVEDDGTWAILSGQLAFTAQSAPAWNDQEAYYDSAISRVAGMTWLTKIAINSTSSFAWMGLSTQAPPGLGGLSNHPAFRHEGGYLESMSNVSLVQHGTDTWKCAVIARNWGCFLLLDDGSGWKLHWVNNTGTGGTTFYPAFSNYAQAGVIDLMRVADLANNETYAVPVLDTRDGDFCSPGSGNGTSKNASPAKDDVYRMTDDVSWRITFDTIPTTGNFRWTLRGTNPNTCIEIRVGTTGVIGLYDSTELIGNYSSLSGGEELEVQLNGDSAKLWVDGSLEVDGTIPHTLTGTGGTYDCKYYLDNGGACSDLELRTLDGVANVSSGNHPGYGLATDVLMGPRSEGDVFTHEKDNKLEIYLNTLPSSGNIDEIFRKQDDDNHWFFRANSGGTYTLYERIASIAYSRGSASGVLSGDERLVVTCEDETIKGYHGNTLDWTYPSAANFKTETNGAINTIATGGQLSDLKAWPRSLFSAPNTPRTKNIDMVLDQMGYAPTPAAPFVFTVDATTSPDTIWINRLTPVGGDAYIDWGDGNVTTVLENETGEITHEYASAGTYTVRLFNTHLLTHMDFRYTLLDGMAMDMSDWQMHAGLVALDLGDATEAGSITGDIGHWNFPSTLTYVSLSNLDVEGDISGFVLHEGLQTLSLFNCPNLYGNVSGWILPSTLTYLSLYQAGITGDLSGWEIPDGMTHINCSHTSCSGDLSGWDLPDTLLGLYLQQANYSGDITDWDVPPNCTVFTIHDNDFEGDISGWSIPATLTLLYVYNTDVEGDVSGWIIPAVMENLRLNNTGLYGTPDISNNTAMELYRYQDCGLSQANVDAVLYGIYLRRMAFTHATPELEIAGTNSAPSGIYQEGFPPSTGKEYAYEVEVDPKSEGFNKWDVDFTP